MFSFLCLLFFTSQNPSTMSILSKNSSNSHMGAPSFHEFKKQASFFFKEKIKSARLALTDVTPAQLLTEEATNGSPWAPDTRTLGSISQAAFEVDDYWRIVEILHKKFLKFDRKNWRVSYNTLIVLEHLLTHGPLSVAKEFEIDRDVIKQMESFQCIDEKGFNWGLAVRKKSERILELLEKESFLKEERDRARKLTRGIQGFGSFCQRSASSGILQESSHGGLTRCHSQFNNHNENEENLLQEDEMLKNRVKLNTLESFRNLQMHEEHETGCKENVAPAEEELHQWTCAVDANLFLAGKRDELASVEDDHPFNDMENQGTASLLSARDGILQGC